MSIKEENSIETVLVQQKNLFSRVDDLDEKFTAMGKDMTDIKSALALLAARPSFDVSKAITLCVQGGILFSMIVSGIIWLSVQLNLAPLTTLQSENSFTTERLNDMRERITRIENTSPGAMR